MSAIVWVLLLQGLTSGLTLHSQKFGIREITKGIKKNAGPIFGNMFKEAAKSWFQKATLHQTGSLTLNATIPEMVVNLDLEPQERWREMAQDPEFRSLIIETVEAWKQVQGFFYPNGHGHTELRQWSQSVIHLDEEFRQELEGLEKYLDDSRVKLDDLMTLQFVYELTAGGACAGVLAVKPDGTVIHGRNMDYKFPFDFRRSLVKVTFTRGGEPLFVSVHTPGLIGVHTGMRVAGGGWSINEMTRKHELGEDHEQVQVHNLESGLHGGLPYMPLVRRLLEDVPDFKTAFKRLSTAHHIGPNYFTMAGSQPWEGAVITSNREGPGAPYTNIQALSKATGRWFVVQTNDDVRQAPLDSRREKAISLMSKSDRSFVSEEAMMRVMRSDALLLDDNIFSSVMIPAEHTVTVHRNEVLGTKGASSGSGMVTF